jgi:hypothetical protein
MGVLACGVALVFCAGCFQAPVVPATGIVYSDFKAPLTSEYDGQAIEAKTGEAESASILGLIAYGDCSIEAAAADGGLSTVTHCDYSFFNVMGVYQRFTVIAHGR